MAVSLSRFSWWLWSGKEKDSVSNSSSSSSSSDHDSIKFPTKKQKKKWQSKEERRSDKQCGGDAVWLEKSDGPDWSIGWVEPHGIDFTSDDGFAVLVPCYSYGCKELDDNSNNQLLSAIKNLPNEFSSEGKICMEWPSFS